MFASVCPSLRLILVRACSVQYCARFFLGRRRAGSSVSAAGRHNSVRLKGSRSRLGQMEEPEPTRKFKRPCLVPARRAGAPEPERTEPPAPAHGRSWSAGPGAPAAGSRPGTTCGTSGPALKARPKPRPATLGQATWWPSSHSWASWSWTPEVEEPAREPETAPESPWRRNAAARTSSASTPTTTTGQRAADAKGAGAGSVEHQVTDSPDTADDWGPWKGQGE